MDMVWIGKYIGECRRRLGLTQEQLAERAGVSKSSVSKWEGGRTVPDVEVLLKLSKLFGVTVNQILEPVSGIVPIESFEELTRIGKQSLCEALSDFSGTELAKAVMGTSPEVYDFIREVLPEIDFGKEIKDIGRVRIEEVEEMQRRIVNRVNLL